MCHASAAVCALLGIGVRRGQHDGSAGSELTFHEPLKVGAVSYTHLTLPTILRV